jgi:hypothetical protein
MLGRRWIAIRRSTLPGKEAEREYQQQYRFDRRASLRSFR